MNQFLLKLRMCNSKISHFRCFIWSSEWRIFIINLKLPVWIETLPWHSETWKTLQWACVCLRLSLWAHFAAVSVFSWQNTRFRPHHLIPHQVKTSLHPPTLTPTHTHSHLGMNAIHTSYRKLKIPHSAVFNAPLMHGAHRSHIAITRMALSGSAAEIWRLRAVPCQLKHPGRTQTGNKTKYHFMLIHFTGPTN